MHRAGLCGSAVVIAGLGGIGGLGGAGCFNEAPLPTYSGTLGGQVVISGPLRGATVFAEQLDLHTGAVYLRVGDAITNEDGRFAMLTGHANGLFRITVRGGSYVDAATRTPLQLDPTDELTSLAWFDLAEVREDILVSPIGHLIDTRARVKLELLGDMTEAMHDASDHLGRHFGDVKDWSRLRLAGLDQPATSPTEEVRAALVHTALSYLAQDIAIEAGSSPQEINVFRLMQRWAADLAWAPGATEELPVWDGNDGNDRRAGSGLQLGACAPLAPALSGTGEYMQYRPLPIWM